jgi:phytoene dehydrogenase-like protein
MPDAIVVGAGPNGLAAAIEVARAGRSVLVLEKAPTPGGGARTAELTLPGFRHDVCSAIHPLGVASPFFRSAGLDGPAWIHPETPLAHPLDDGRAVLLHRSLSQTAGGLGRDGQPWTSLFGPLVRESEAIIEETTAPAHIPRHPVAMARFGLRSVRSATSLARRRFETDDARALFAGLAAHSFLRLDRLPSASFGLVLGLLGHAVGWPMPQGGSQSITDALVAKLRALGGELECDREVRSLDDLPQARAIVLDVTPRQLLRLAGSRLSDAYRRHLRRYRYGPGVFKIDWALDGPIPWKASECVRAGTVHLGGTMPEMAAAEVDVAAGRNPERPYVIVAQQSLFDPTRAPSGKHTGWAYCHVPHGSDRDMTEAIESQVERFAPGFRDLVLARRTRGPAQLEDDNPNLVGGDINGGIQDLRQLFTRPVPRLDPYRTSDPRVFLCSSSTPPGGGVHGMCGYYAARSVLRRALA